MIADRHLQGEFSACRRLEKPFSFFFFFLFFFFFPTSPHLKLDTGGGGQRLLYFTCIIINTLVCTVEVQLRGYTTRWERRYQVLNDSR